MDISRIDAAALLSPHPLRGLRGHAVDRLSWKGVAVLTLSASFALGALIISAGAAILRLELP